MIALHPTAKGLLWKETRQLVPLMVILIGVGLFLTIASSGIGWNSRSLWYAGRYIPLILPVLFSVGAGAVLVGQEKELKTLWWLASFPVSPLRVFTVKLAVAFAGLVLMWMICWALSIVSSGPSRSGSIFAVPFAATPRTINIVFLHVHSVFLLVCGFYTGWRFRQAFTSLLVVVPLAAIPFVLVQTGYALREMITGWRSIPPHSSAVTLLLVTVIGTLIVLSLAYLAARKSLMPAEPPVRRMEGPTWRDAMRPSGSITCPRTPFRFPLSSLVWQSVTQRRWVLGGLVGIVLIGLICGVVFLESEDGRNRFSSLLLLGMLGVPVGLSWLGVFAFIGDGNVYRIRFLAERGVSPTKAWLGRQLAGLNAIAIVVLFYAVLSLSFLSRSESGNAVPIPSIALFTLAALVLYGVSQWISQLLQLLAASACAAPPLSCFAVYWLGYAAVELDAPLWLLVICAALPLVASLTVMRRYMDGHRGWPSWATAAVASLLFVILPIAPAAAKYARFARMPGERRAALLREGRVAWTSTHLGAPIAMDPVETNTYELTEPLTAAEAIAEFERRSFSPRDRLPSLADSASSAMAIDPYAFSAILGSASTQWLRLQAANDPQEAIESVGDWISTLTSIAKGLRLSRRLLDQQHADIIEIWLTQTLASEAMQPYLDRPFATAALELIGDQPGRVAARRRALLASWYETQRSDATFYRAGLGGFPDWDVGNANREGRRFRNLRRDAVVDAAVRLLDAGAAGRPVEPMLRELHELVVPSMIDFVDGPYSSRFRAAADSFQRLKPYHPHGVFPATQWFAPWEADAIRMAEAHAGKGTP